MNVKIEVITPEVAKEFLKNNTSNRTIKESAVNEYSRMMKLGKWIPNHQGIAFDDTGALVDGQHRLLAVIKSESMIPMLVTRGLPAASQDVVDAGRKRSVADQMHIRHGVVGGVIKTAVMRSISLICGYDQRASTIHDLLVVWGIYADTINEVCNATGNFKPSRRAGILGALSFALISHPEKVRDFLGKLVSGEGISKGEPVHTFRNHIINTKIPAGGTGSVLYLQLTFNALYHHVHGNSLTMMKKGPNGMDFFKSKQRDNIAKINAQYAS